LIIRHGDITFLVSLSASLSFKWNWILPGVLLACSLLACRVASIQETRGKYNAHSELFAAKAVYYELVTARYTVHYASVTSIMHCRPCCNFLISFCYQRTPE